MWTRPYMRDVMRNGMHVMVPDDHDIVNALRCVNMLDSSRRIRMT